MIDLMKLTPAPWGSPSYAKENGRVTTPYGSFEVGSGRSADAEFIALARIAFDVMLRRGWSAILNPCDEKTWRVDMNDGTCFAYGREEEFDAGVNPADWPDPFTALVEADRWYAEHVEKASNP